MTDPEDRPYVRLVPASSVRIERPAWAWDRRWPIGGVSLLAGREGGGKTTITTLLMAEITRGTLAGEFEGRPAHVVYVGLEDDRSSVLVPRLVAAGADLARVHFVDMPGHTAFTTADVEALDASLTQLGGTLGALIIDPLDAHLGGGVDTHRKAEVQSAVGRLATLAQRHRCAIVGIAHMNKGESLDILLKIVGSVGFSTSARSVLAVGPHPEAPDERVVVLRKSNMADERTVPAIRFRIEPDHIAAPDGGEPIETSRAVVLGEQVGMDANAILSIPNAAERTAEADAAEWLLDVLGEGPLPSKDVKRMARDADHAERTLARAREAIGVLVERDPNKRGRPTTWRLPDSTPPLSGQIPSGTDGTEPETLLTEAFGAMSSVTCHGANTEDGTERLAPSA